MSFYDQVAPETVGFNNESLCSAVSIANGNEIGWSRDLDRALALGALDVHPYRGTLGITRPRGGPAGIIMRYGHVVATWGDIRRSDFTFSVAKSFLSLLTGLAVHDGLIADIHDKVADYQLDDGFESAQNAGVTWYHLLTQTSEWEGELFGKSDMVDRYRQLHGDNTRKGHARPLQSPGTYWEYNDVRVNRLSLSLMRIFRQPLPMVLANRIMNPIGTSNSWKWHGYRNSQVTVDGTEMFSVPGGTHWGGGLCISAADQALVGQLVLDNGVFRGKVIIPHEWFEIMFTPCHLNPLYGSLWWLNSNRDYMPSAPESSVFASGAGGNDIWIDESLGLVCVTRWLDPNYLDDFVGAVIGSLT